MHHVLIHNNSLQIHDEMHINHGDGSCHVAVCPATVHSSPAGVIVLLLFLHMLVQLS